MFTIPAPKATIGGAGITVTRPSASAGVITGAASAYDLIAGRGDDPPYSTAAVKSTVTGSFTPGTVDYVTMEYNTFASEFAGGSLPKANFSAITLTVGISATLTAIVLSSAGWPGFASTTYVCPSLLIDYQVDGSTWVNFIKKTCVYPLYPSVLNEDCGVAANVSPIVATDVVLALGSSLITTTTKETGSVAIPSAYFSSDLNNLKVRFVLGTCTNNAVTSYKSSGTYSIWDIRANIT